MRNSKLVLTFAALVTGLLLCGVLYARNRSEDLTFERSDAKVLDIEVDFSAGKFDIVPLSSGGVDCATLSGYYDEEYFDFHHEFDIREGRAKLYFETNNIRNSHRDTDNDWILSVSPDVETRMNIDIGASNSRFDFGGLTLSELDLDIGAADATIRFSEMNKTRMRYLSIDAGACDLEIEDLGNANFEFLDFDGGVGDFTLDFGDNIDYEAEIKVDVGLGSVDIILPKNLGVRLECSDDDWMTSISFPKRELIRSARYDDVFETENFDSAKGRITLILDVGMGSADIGFR